MNWGKFKFTDNRFIILQTLKTFSRTDSGKSWRSNPDKVENKVIPPEFYQNYVTAIPFFNNFFDHPEATCRAEQNYTHAGYLPTRITTISPFRETKVIAEFRFIPKEYLEESAGWREKEVLKNAKEFAEEVYRKDGGVHRRVEFINPKESGVTHSATWDTYSRRWVN